MPPAPSGEELLFPAARLLLAGDRAAYLDRECAGDPALRVRIDAERQPLPAREDLPAALQAYVADAQRRLDHDRQFPGEPKQVKPGEDLRFSEGRAQVSGSVAVTGINALVAKTVLLSRTPAALGGSARRFLERARASFLRLGSWVGVALIAISCRPPSRPPDASLHLYDLVAGQKAGIVRGHFYPTRTIAPLPGSVLVLTSDGSQELRLWDLRQKQQVAVFDPFQAMGYLDSGRQAGSITHVQFVQGTNLLLAAHERAGLSLWDLQRQTLLRTLPAPFPEVSTLVVSPDQTAVTATGPSDAIVVSWRLADGKPLGVFTEEWLEDAPHAGSPDSSWVTLARDGTARSWWNAHTGEPWAGGDPTLGRTRMRSRHQATLTPDGRTLLTYAAGFESQPDIHRFQLWDLETGRLLWRRSGITLSIIHACRAYSSCEAFAFSSDSRRLAIGLRDGRVEIREVQDGRLRGEFATLPSACERLMFLPDGRRLLTWGGSVVRLWEVESGKLVQAFEVPILCSLAVTPDSRWLLVGGGGEDQGL